MTSERKGLPGLNQRASGVVKDLKARASLYRVEPLEIPGGGIVIDAGVQAAGGLAAGIAVARACVADLAEISILPASSEFPGSPTVQIWTDYPVTACMASQYAGWQISVGSFKAMGSGPMRTAHDGEELIRQLGCREHPEVLVGVLETSVLPGAEVLSYIAGKTGIAAENINLIVARTRSVAGGIQVVARTVETALHKLHFLGFDLSRVEHGLGQAPLPPPAKGDLGALGRTNDAVLYGGRVTLWVRGDDDSLRELGPNVPSSSSRDYGAPFRQIFERYGFDFYKVDPGLFSPAQLTFHNIETGKTHRFGAVDRNVLEKSFFG